MSKKLKAFKVCECDSFSAYDEEQAREEYKKYTGLHDDEIYPLDEVYVMPESTKLATDYDGGFVTVGEVLKEIETKHKEHNCSLFQIVSTTEY